MKKSLISTVIMSTLSLSAGAQAPSGIFKYKTGDITITTLSEGQQQGNVRILIGATKEMLDKYAPDGTFPNSCNAFLVRSPQGIVLIDTGYGRKLWDNLAEAGVEPQQIDAVLLTHTHGDHTGGLLRDGKSAFAKAKIYLSKPEYDFWLKQESAEPIRTAYKGRIETFDIAQGEPVKLMPPIAAYATFGHTPGHVAYMVGSGNDRILVWGDLTHAMAVQMPYPLVSVTYDSDPVQAARSREAVLDKVADFKVPIAGMHIAYPGMGTISKDNGGGFVFTPIK